MPADDDYGSWVRNRRRQLTLSQEELAEQAQVSARTVRNIESGRHPDPRPSTRRQIDDVLRRADDRAGSFAPAQLPPGTAAFVGRVECLEEMDDLLTGNSPSLCVISGMPGVGKTALAVQWSHRVAAEFPDGQLYVDIRGYDSADKPLDTADVLRGFLDALGIDHGQHHSLPHLIASFRSSVRDRRVLVVLDNARTAAQVRPLLAGGRRCVTIVTSREQMTGLVAVDGARPILVEPLSPTDAGALLTARIGAPRVAADPSAAQRIVNRCGYLPLALGIVSARAALHPHFPLAVLASELDEHPALDAFDGGEPVSDIRTVFSWSYRRLTDRAAQTLRAMGHLRAGPVAAETVAAAVGRPLGQTRRTLLELNRASLVVEVEPGRVGAHDLIRAYALEISSEVDDADARADMRARILDHYLRTAELGAHLLRPHRPRQPFPALRGVPRLELADERTAMAWYAREADALNVLLDHAVNSGDDRTTWRLSEALSAFLGRLARWPQLAHIGALAYNAAARLNDESGRLSALSVSGRAHVRLDALERAADAFRAALRLASTRGVDAELATAHFDLALLAEASGDHRTALVRASEARDHYRSAGNRAGEAFALNAMGWDHIQLGRPARAVPLCRAAVELYHECHNRHGEAATWDTLGLAHHLLGDQDDAISSFHSALALVVDTGDRQLECSTLHRLGLAHSVRGDHRAAHRAWQRALATLEAAGRTDELLAKQVREALDVAPERTAVPNR